MKSSDAQAPEAFTAIRSTTTVTSAGLGAVAAYFRDPESIKIANAAASAVDPIVAQQTRRQCHASDRLFPADLDDLRQAAMILLFNKGYLLGNHLLREAIRRSDEEERVAGVLRSAVATAVRFSLRQFLREPFVRARNKSALISGPDTVEIEDLQEERDRHNGIGELCGMSLEYLASASREEKQILQFRLQSMTYDEIGTSLEMPPKQVKAVMRSLRKKLRRMSSFRQPKPPSPVVRLRPERTPLVEVDA